MKRLMLILIIAVGALCPLYSASIDELNGVDWATKAEDFNGVDVATKVSAVNGVTATPPAPTNYVTLAKAVWSWEDDHLLEDSSGNGETLTADYGTPANSESQACYGSSSANQTTVWSAIRAGTDLSEDYPGRATPTALSVVARWYTGAGSLSSTTFYFYNHFYAGGFASLYQLGIASGKAYFNVFAAGEHKITGDTTLAENTTYIITGVWTGTNIQIWVNKAQDKTQVSLTSINSGSTNYAARPFYWPDVLAPRGYIDYIAVFDYALSESDIASIVDHCIDGSD